MTKRDERFYWQTWSRLYNRESYTAAKARKKYLEKREPRVFVPVVTLRKRAA